MATSIDTSVISQNAATIEGLNNRLAETLKQSVATVSSLTSTGAWTGQAAEATVSAITTFAKRYDEEYSEKLSQYVAFLRREAAAGYEETERSNVRKADGI